MRITCDEARILANALSESKYELMHNINSQDKSLLNKAAQKLQLLEDTLIIHGKDRRRNGRVSDATNSFSDCMKRYAEGK